jgi:hypothetical protein
MSCVATAAFFNKIGHQRHFERALGTSALAPTPDMSMRRSAMARGLILMASVGATTPAAWRSSRHAASLVLGK